MAPPQWIHCNLCYYVFSRKDRKFYQTSCFHVICRNCTVHSDRGQLCPVCKRQGIKFCEICNEMDPKEKALYNPDPFRPIEVASKSIVFQRKQKKHLMVQVEATEEKLRKLSRMEQEARAKIVDYQQKFDRVREKRKTLQDVIRAQNCSNLSPDSAELLPLRWPATQGKGNTSFGGEDFFDSDTQSRRSDGSVRSRDSFLDMVRGKDGRPGNNSSSSNSSLAARSVDFGSTPSSAAGRISEQLHRMQIQNQHHR